MKGWWKTGQKCRLELSLHIIPNYKEENVSLQWRAMAFSRLTKRSDFYQL